MPLPVFPHQPYPAAFEAWRSEQIRLPAAVSRAWAEAVGLVLVHEVFHYGAHPEMPAPDRTYARSLAWEDFDMALRGGASGLMRHAMERFWMAIRTEAARAALGAALTEAAAVAHAEAERSGWRARYGVGDLARPILTNPHAHGIAEVAKVYNEEGTANGKRARLSGAPDVDALRRQLFGWRPGGAG